MDDVFSYGATRTQRNVIGVEVDALSGCGETLQDLIQVFSSAWKPGSATLLNQQQNCLLECESQKVCPVLNVVWRLLLTSCLLCQFFFYFYLFFFKSEQLQMTEKGNHQLLFKTDRPNQSDWLI